MPHQLSKLKRASEAIFVFSLLSIFVLSAADLFSQNLPDKIRGYKVHKAKISVKTEANKRLESDKDSDTEAFVKIGNPNILDVTLTGITFELSANLSSIEQTGEVDFLTFHDFRVNGLKVDVEEYESSFEFQKNKELVLPEPFRIFLSSTQALSGAVKEMKDSKAQWRVTGRVFVFGHFKKSIFKFKRVIPVDIDIMITNPLKNLINNEKTDAKK